MLLPLLSCRCCCDCDRLAAKREMVSRMLALSQAALHPKAAGCAVGLVTHGDCALLHAQPVRICMPPARTMRAPRAQTSAVKRKAGPLFAHRRTSLHRCARRRFWFNLTIKVFVVLFSYINFLPVRAARRRSQLPPLDTSRHCWTQPRRAEAEPMPCTTSDLSAPIGRPCAPRACCAPAQIPWRLAILHHLTCSRRSCAVGRDFYGRPTAAMWFNLSIRSRRWIALWLNLAYVFHFVCLMEHIVYQSFLEGQTWPGGFAQNLPFVLSIAAAITGGVLQGRAEEQLIRSRPECYPPRPVVYFKTAALKWWRGACACGCACGRGGGMGVRGRVCTLHLGTEVYFLTHTLGTEVCFRSHG